MFNSVIFDVDGTLLDATEGILKSVSSSIEYFNLPPLPKETLLQFVGPPVLSSAMRFFQLSETQAQKFTDYFRTRYAAGDVFLAKPYPDIFKLLDILKSKGLKLGVATYKRQDYALELMKHFGFDKYMSAICGADNDNKLTKTDIVNLCIEKLGAAKDSTVLIGDSVHDATGAQNAGISFIGVTYGFGFKSKDEILKYNPAFCAGSIAELLQYFEK